MADGAGSVLTRHGRLQHTYGIHYSSPHRYPMTLAAQNVGITAKLLSRWQREQQQPQDAAFPGQGHQTPEQAELRR